jgi:predicted ATPase
MTYEPTILTPDQRVRVFVSSSLKELAAEREAVRSAVLGLRLMPVMFEQGARPHAPRDLYRAYVEQSQIFVGVYGESYGWVAPGADRSGLAEELALAGPRPRLIYAREPAPGRDPRLAALLDDLRRAGDVTYRTFGSADELRSQVEADLATLLAKRFAQAPPASWPEPPAGGLPAARTRLIGRDDDLAAVGAMLTDGDKHLVTLVGPGGIGKTRLATTAAQRVADRFPDGVRYVDLSAVSAFELMGEALARGLGVRTSGSVPVATDLASWLRTKRLLLVVDNFEQLTDAAPVLAEILRAAPGVTALVTSRAPLRLAGEWVYPVPPLPAAGPDPANAPAVRLFVDRARAVSGRFAVTTANAGAVVEIARRLDGLPLAIELAAAKVRMLSPDAIVDRLGDRFGLLTGGARDLPDRQRTLRDTIAWSYRLLGPGERGVFDRLGVFAGACDLAAVEAVTGPRPDLLDVMAALVESSLVTQQATAQGEPRFTMLETIRAFAREKLRDSGDWAAAAAAHAGHYRRLARDLEPLLDGPGAPGLLRGLELEHDNIAAALDWFFDHDDPAAALEIMWATWPFWWRRGHVEEGNRHMSGVLDRVDLLDDTQAGLALMLAGGVALVSGQLDRAEEVLRPALPRLRAGGHVPLAALAAVTVAQLAGERGDLRRSDRYLLVCRELSPQVGTAWESSLFHSRLALIALREGRLDEARDNVAAARDAAGPEHLATVVAEYVSALYEIARGEVDAARRHLVDGLSVAAAAGDEGGLGTFLAAIADLDTRTGHLERAVRLAAAAQALRTPSNEMWMRGFVAPWPASGLDAEAVRARLGPAGYDAAWQAGERLAVADAVAEAVG